MNIQCSICSDHFSQSEDIYSTPCGHVFHQVCLLQWIERSSTCPQCRKKTTEKNIIKIYFNFPNSVGITLDASTLQAKLDNAEFQLREKEKSINHLKDEISKVEHKYLETNEQLLNMKDKLKSKTIAMSGLVEQNEFLKNECKEITKLRSSNEQLQKQIDLLKGLEEVVYGTTSEVESMMKNSRDVTELSTYVVVLKRAVMDSENKKKVARDNLQHVQNHLSKVNMEKKDLEVKVMSLENSLSHSDDEIKQLKQRIFELEKKNDVRIESNPAHAVVDVRLQIGEPVKRKSDSSLVDKYLASKLHFRADSQGKPSTSRNISTMKENIKLVPDSSSPYLNIKQCANPMSLYIKKKTITSTTSTKTSEFTIFKGNRLEKMKSENDIESMRRALNKRPVSEAAYDGLGGHSKLDEFPTPKRITPQVKRPSLKSIMKRVERPSNQKKIEDLIKRA